jgi:hypothetical protein
LSRQVAALVAPAAGALADLECAALLLYAAESRRFTAPEEATRLRECAIGVAWFVYQHHHEGLRRPDPRQFEAIIFRAPPVRVAAAPSVFTANEQEPSPCL